MAVKEEVAKVWSTSALPESTVSKSQSPFSKYFMFSLFRFLMLQ